MNTFILVERRRKELITAINNVKSFYDLCVNNDCLNDDLKLKTTFVELEIERVETLMDTPYHTLEDISYRKRVCDRFLDDAQELLREMSIAVSKCF